MNYTYVDSPLGALLIAGDDEGLQHIVFPREGKAAAPSDDWRASHRGLARTARELTEYFAGARRIFDLNLKPSGTPFQLAVLVELLRIPYGETISYGQLASRIGKPRAIRAVGAANGRNPLPIVIPCHRVIGSDGSLIGFGGGLAAKQFLLDLESPSRQKTLF